jgi:hypothetical protein
MFGEPGAEFVFHDTDSAPWPTQLKRRNLADRNLSTDSNFLKACAPCRFLHGQPSRLFQRSSP